MLCNGFICNGEHLIFPGNCNGFSYQRISQSSDFRRIPLKYRIDVAMSGRLGMEIQPQDMTTEEKELCKKAIAEYKEIRPVVQFGDIYRLISPYEKQGVASLMYTSPEKIRLWYIGGIRAFHNQHLPRVQLYGLIPEANYQSVS